MLKGASTPCAAGIRPNDKSRPEWTALHLRFHCSLGQQSMAVKTRDVFRATFDFPVLHHPADGDFNCRRRSALADKWLDSALATLAVRLWLLAAFYDFEAVDCPASFPEKSSIRSPTASVLSTDTLDASQTKRSARPVSKSSSSVRFLPGFSLIQQFNSQNSFLSVPR